MQDIGGGIGHVGGQFVAQFSDVLRVSGEFEHNMSQSCRAGIAILRMSRSVYCAKQHLGIFGIHLPATTMSWLSPFNMCISSWVGFDPCKAPRRVDMMSGISTFA